MNAIIFAPIACHHAINGCRQHAAFFSQEQIFVPVSVSACCQDFECPEHPIGKSMPWAFYESVWLAKKHLRSKAWPCKGCIIMQKCKADADDFVLCYCREQKSRSGDTLTLMAKYRVPSVLEKCILGTRATTFRWSCQSVAWYDAACTHVCIL